MGVGEIDIGQSSAAHPIYLAPIVLDPGRLPQIILIAHRSHNHFARTETIRMRSDLEPHLLTCRSCEEAIRFFAGSNFVVINGKQVLADGHNGSWLCQRGYQVGGPALAVVYPRKAVPTVLHRKVCTQQTDIFIRLRRRWHIASTGKDMAAR